MNPKKRAESDANMILIRWKKILCYDAARKQWYMV
jgi:hypothetical protein